MKNQVRCISDTYVDLYVDPLKHLQKVWYDALPLSGYHIIKDRVASWDWYLSSTQI